MRPRRALVTSVLVMLVGGIASGVAWVIHVSLTKGLRAAIVWAQLGSAMLTVFGVVPVLAAISGWRRRIEGSDTLPTADQVDHAHRTLAALVLGQWREEIVVRQVDDPTPLAVRWRLTELPGMDLHGHVLRPNLLRTLLGRGRRRFVGRTDRIGKLAEEFNRLPRRRLVILGGPGSGKTTLAVLLIRELLRRYEPDRPVPVLLSMSDWRPGDEPLYGWLARRLVETYPALRAAHFGSDVAMVLIKQRRILPVLDGLDELPESVRPEALATLNATMSVDDPLLLTCRTAEYEVAVTRDGGAAIVGGAVIQPDPLRPDDVITYLRSCLRKRPHGGWSDLFSALADPDRPMTGALATPLDLWLLRRVYVDTGLDPGELLDSRRFPTATAITDHLLDHLVRTAIASVPPHQGSDRSSSSSPRHSWDPDSGHRWLSFLAHHLNTIGSRDLAWWRLYRAVPRVRLVHRLTLGLVLALILGPVAGLAGALGGGLSAAPLTGFAGAFVGGVAGGPILALVGGYTARPAYGNLRLQGRFRVLVRKLTATLAMGLAAGLTSVLIGGLVARTFVDVLPLGLAVGLSAGLVFGLVEWVTTPLPNDPAQTPVGTLHRDLQLMIGRTTSAVVICGFLLGMLAGLLGGSVVVLVLAAEGAGAILLLFSAYRWNGTASSVYLATVTALRWRRRVPRRLMRFLDDAHRVGLLRRVGPVYQFRHAKLQDRLADTYETTH